jgi:hypothetical protein
MEPPASSEPADSKGFGSDASSLRDAAKELDKGRSNLERPVDEIAYRRQGEDGKIEREFESKTVKAERAARDLAEFRARREKEAELQAEAALREHVDDLKRGGPGKLNAPQQAQPQSSQSAENVQGPDNAYSTAQNFRNLTPEQQASYAARAQTREYDAQLIAGAKDANVRQNVKYTQHALAQRMQQIDAQIGQNYITGQDTAALTLEYQNLYQQYEQINYVDRAQDMMQRGYSPAVATAMANREVLEFITKATDGYERAFAEHIQEQSNIAKDIVNATAKAFLSSFPELAHCRTQSEVDVAFRTIRNQSPARADYLENCINQFNRAISQGMSMREQMEKVKAEDFKNYSLNEDFKFANAHKFEYSTPEHRLAVSNDCMKMLMSPGIGMTMDEICNLYHNEKWFRSAQAQTILLRATQYWKAKNGIPGKRAPADPVRVLKPGSGENRIDADRVERLPNSMSAREAARILENRRRARR